MARALEYPIVFKALLDDGHISSTHYVQRPTEYEVFQQSTNRIAQKIGHITEKQFEVLVSLGIIKPKSSTTDKRGNTINFYMIRKE